MTRPGETVDLTNCDREPIHVPGAILPHGAMLVIDRETFEVLQAAGDTPRLIGNPIPALLGGKITDWLRPDQAQRLRKLCLDADLAKPRHLLDPALRFREDVPLDASVHMSEGLIIIECEAAEPEERHAFDPLACVHEMSAGLEEMPTLQAFCQAAAERVRAVTGYDRVMIYRFLDDGAGWVFAESRIDRLPPFLDLHYPASDIPKQARALYLKNWLRLITQVDYQPAPLIPPLNPRTGRTIDMSQATLRDVSPIHREYLRNMGVDASMSISIIREGRLWGLIACHHGSPRRLPRHLRAVCELFGSMFSLQLESRERSEMFEARLSSRRVLQHLMRQLAQEEDYGQGLVRIAQNLLDYIESGGLSVRVGRHGGVAIRVNASITSVGVTPSDDQISALADWLATTMGEGDGLFHTDRLGEVWPPARAFADVASGLLAISVSREPRDFILWFRPEVIHTVSWGGDPNKPVEAGPDGARLTPRKSFEVWRETVRGRSSAWREADSDAAFDLRVALLEVVLRRIDAAARERERAFRQERLLMAELDHRVKNTLANIQALVTQTSRSAASLTEFVEGLAGRIAAMAKAHSLLTQSRWEGVKLQRLLSDELLPYERGGANIRLSGSDLTLTPKAALALSLAVHELATNAAKFGALSTPQGMVAVAWSTTRDGGLELRWHESGGPEVKPPKRRGFGSTLIERALAIETEGASSLIFASSGVRCDITLPLSAVVQNPPQPGADRTDPEPEMDDITGVARRRVLVAEDSALVLMEMEQIFADLGWEMVGPATRLAHAIDLARSETVDAALLDLNLAGQMTFEVAAVLQQRGIPFAFCTGYDRDTILPSEFATSRVVNKPFQLADLDRCLREMTNGNGAG